MDPRVVIPEMISIGNDFYEMGDLSAALNNYEEAMNVLLRFENNQVPLKSRSSTKYKKATTCHQLESTSAVKWPSCVTPVSPRNRNNDCGNGKSPQCRRESNPKRELNPLKTNFLDEPFTIDSTQGVKYHYPAKSVASILLFNMALVEFKAGSLSTSAQLFAAAIFSFEENNQQEDPFDFFSREFLPAAASNNLGYLHFKNGLLDNALESFFDAFRFGQNALRQITDYDNAVTFWEEKIINLRKKLTFVVHNMAVTSNFLGESYQRDKEVDQAIRIFKTANDTRKLFKCFSDEEQLPSVYLITLFNVGTIHYDLGNHIEAMHAFDLFCTSRGHGYSYDENRVLLSILFNMGKMALEIDDLPKALTFFQELISIGDMSPTKIISQHVSQAWYHIGWIHSNRGEYNEAIESLSKALELEESCLGTDHPDLVLTLMHIGRVHHKCGRLKCALVAFKEGLRIAKKSIGEQHQIISEILSEIGGVCLEEGNFDEAEDSFAESSNFSIHGQTFEDDIFCDLTKRAIPSVMLSYPQGAAVA